MIYNCVSFRCIARWFEFFFRFFSIIGYYKDSQDFLDNKYIDYTQELRPDTHFSFYCSVLRYVSARFKNAIWYSQFHSSCLV